MTIQWGSWQFSGGNGMRVGLDVSVPLAPAHSSTVATFEIRVYTQNQYTYPSDAQSLDYTDDIAGSFAFTNGEGSQIVQREFKTHDYTYGAGEYGYSPGNQTFTATISGAFNGITPTVTVSYPIPARPTSGPAACTDSLLVRNSDSQVTLTWTPNPTVPEPYSYQQVSMRRWNGSTVWTEASWNVVATVSGATGSYVKGGLSANHAYQLSPRAVNSHGVSEWNDSNVVFMTPAAPSNVASVLNTAGTAITTTWTDNAYNYPGAGSWKIQRSVAGGAFADLDTVADQDTTSYVDNSPGGGTNQYRIAAVVTGPLQSAYATGNTVSAPAEPQAPTLLDPDGTYVDFVNDDVDFTWQHNPGGTGVAQTHFTIEYSDDAGSNWYALGTATDVASAVSSFTLPAGTLANGVPYLWKVQTEGLVSAGYSDFSASAAVTGSTKPSLTLTLPEATTDTIPIVATWVYSQAELLPQLAYVALLYADDGVTLLEEIDGFGAGTTVAFTYATVTGNDYIVRVLVQSSAEIWSEYDEVTTSFDLLPPAAVQVTGSYQECQGTVLLHFEPEAAEEGVTVAVESVTLERMAPGEDWVTLAAGLLIPTDFLDTLPATNGTNQYRITALSATPSQAVGPILEVEGTDGVADGSPLWVWVSYGDSFEHDLRFHGDPQISRTSGRLKAQQHFLGRAKPVALVGQATSSSLAVSGTLYFDPRCAASTDLCAYDSAPQLWDAAGTDSEVVCYRDYTGRRLFGTLSDVTVGNTVWPGHAEISFSVIVVDFTERYIQLVEA